MSDTADKPRAIGGIEGGSFQVAQLAALADIVAKPETGPTWLRDLAMEAVLVAICHQGFADANSLHEGKEAMAALGDAVRGLHKKALGFADYHVKLDRLLNKPANKG